MTGSVKNQKIKPSSYTSPPCNPFVRKLSEAFHNTRYFLSRKLFFPIAYHTATHSSHFCENSDCI